MLKFKQNFQLGASTSALQTEGIGTTNRGKLAFDEYYQLHPEIFYDQVGPNITSDVMNHYLEDIEMYQEIGLDSLRTGFSWARLFPDGINLDLDAVKYYHQFLQALKKAKIKVYMTLFHFDMPNWAHLENGWANSIVIERFINYAKFVFEEYHDEVDYFVTFNEPLVPVYEGYLGTKHYPAINDVKQAIDQGLGIFLANAKVIKLYRELKLNVPIGIVYNWNYSYPLTNSKADQQAALIQDAYVNRGPLNIMSRGIIDPLLVSSLKEFNLLPKISKEDLKILKATKVDFLGINYYFPCRVEAIKNDHPRWAMDNLKLTIPKTAKMNPFRNWEIYPQGLYDIGMAIKTEFNNIPWYVAENGIGVQDEEKYRDEHGIINDQYRINYVNDHLTQIKKSIDQGSNCFGYHMWTLIDCWSFTNAYKNRYGLIELDLKTQQRTLKRSAYWYAELIKNKEGNDNEKTQ